MPFASREEKNTFCIPNFCGLNIAKDAILTGPEAEFISVENRQNPREWKCKVFFSMQCSSALEVTILNEVAQSSVFCKFTTGSRPSALTSIIVCACLED